MNKRIAKGPFRGCRVPLVVLCVFTALTGCVKEITSDERLDRDTTRSDASKSTTAGELAKLKCDDINTELAKARDDSKTEEGRLTAYIDMLDRVKSRTQKFEEAISRNPDLAYQEGSQEIMSARDGCVQSQAEVRLDLEGLVREVMQMPTVDEIRNNSTVKVARLNFEVLRTAIEKLDLDDKDALQTRLATAEKAVEVKDGKRKRDK